MITNSRLTFLQSIEPDVAALQAISNMQGVASDQMRAVEHAKNQLNRAYSKISQPNAKQKSWSSPFWSCTNKYEKQGTSRALMEAGIAPCVSGASPLRSLECGHSMRSSSPTLEDLDAASENSWSVIGIVDNESATNHNIPLDQAFQEVDGTSTEQDDVVSIMSSNTEMSYDQCMERMSIMSEPVLVEFPASSSQKQDLFHVIDFIQAFVAVDKLDHYQAECVNRAVRFHKQYEKARMQSIFLGRIDPRRSLNSVSLHNPLMILKRDLE
ncbi:hypothetical protein FRB95_013198, partial [Tulasnella sp. JGI-2019a]